MKSKQDRSKTFGGSLSNEAAQRLAAMDFSKVEKRVLHTMLAQIFSLGERRAMVELGRSLKIGGSFLDFDTARIVMVCGKFEMVFGEEVK